MNQNKTSSSNIKTSLGDFLIESDGKHSWKLPEQFNIGVACVDNHVNRGNGDKLAFIFENHKQSSTPITYQQLFNSSNAVANGLSQLGLEQGDRILIRLPNMPEYPTTFFAALKFGAIAVPTSTLLAAEEVAFLAKDSGAKVLVTHQSMWQELADAIKRVPSLETVILVGDDSKMVTSKNLNYRVISFDKLVSQQSNHFEPVDSLVNDPAYLVYTSGTTGYPKGVLHAHRALIGRLPASEYWFDFSGNDRILHSGKFNWTYVLGSALMDPLFHGQTVVVYEGPNDASTWPELIRRHECTIFIGVPTIYRQIIQKTEFAKNDVPSLRHCMSAGEHLSDEMLLAWRKRFGQDIYEAIGMSELSYYISQNKLHPIKPGAAGFAQPGHQVKLLDDSLTEVSDREEGMICIPLDDPGLFLTYWQREEETQAAKHDGYFFTGDYARVDEQGYIWFVGRKDDIINTFGYRVSPHEIERAIKTHPAVADCVAVGETIAKDKNIVAAYIIVHSGQSVTEEAMLDFGLKHLAKYKAPKKIYFVSDYPRTKNGKVIRKKLTAS